MFLTFLVFIGFLVFVEADLPEIWYCSTPLASDIGKMYTSPNEWSKTASVSHAIKFYSQQMRKDCPASDCGNANLTLFQEVDAFQELKNLNLKTAIESGGIKDWDCTGYICEEYLLQVFENVDNSGGHVDYVDMDEPYFAAIQYCGMEDVNSIANLLVNNFIVPLKANVSYAFDLGDIEPYPALSADEILDWLDTLISIGGEGIIQHFHVDVDFHAVGKNTKEAKSDMLKIRDFCDQHTLTFAVIVNPAGFGPTTDEEYYYETMKNMNWWIENLGHPGPGYPSSRVIFQSWEPNVPINLPETGPYTGTKIVLDSVALFQGE